MILRYFVFRHGETDWNLQKKFQGHTDIPLNANGMAQALVLAEKIQKLQLKVILSSDLLRAIKTAEIALGGRTVPFRIHADLRETHLGDAEGLTHEEINSRFGEDIILKWKSIATEDFHYQFPNGEKKSDHLLRLRRFLEAYAHSESHQSGDQIGVSTHGGSLVRLVHSCENAPDTPIAIPNCAIHEINYVVPERRWIYVGEI